MLKIEKMTFDDFLKEWNSNCPTLTIQTSGSTGKPKKIIVEKAQMLASARMTCDTLNLKKGDTALLCMPLEYIAGKMMAIRSIEREMNLISIPPCSNPLRHFIGTTQKIDFAAFVPEGNYFLLGDNRVVSLDSREFGSFGKEDILGKTSLVIFPFERFGFK
jgi:phenylacetate-coenzyme A ligase PaaK-like adenylate-forming protein